MRGQSFKVAFLAASCFLSTCVVAARAAAPPTVTPPTPPTPVPTPSLTPAPTPPPTPPPGSLNLPSAKASVDRARAMDAAFMTRVQVRGLEHGRARPDRRRPGLQPRRPGLRAADRPGPRQGQLKSCGSSPRARRSPSPPRSTPTAGPKPTASPSSPRPRSTAPSRSRWSGSTMRMSPIFRSRRRWVRKSSFRDGSMTRSRCSRTSGNRFTRSRANWGSLFAPPANYARNNPSPDGGRHVILATNRPVSFRELRNSSAVFNTSSL